MASGRVRAGARGKRSICPGYSGRVKGRISIRGGLELEMSIG